MVRAMKMSWCMLALCGVVAARAGADVNPRAKEDIAAFVKKVEEGDALFNQKKYAEAATALAAAQNLYDRANRRDESAYGVEITLKPQTFPALRYYGYGMGPNQGIDEDMARDEIKTTARNLQTAEIQMWQDAAVLSDAAQVPSTISSTEPSMVDLTEDQLNSIVSWLYNPVAQFKLPVPDDEWHDVVLWSRRAQLIAEHALQKYPAWRTATNGWSGGKTGDEALAEIKAKLAEAEPEYQKVVADFRKAEPPRVAEFMRQYLDELNGAIAGVKKNGWLNWVLARDLYITNDYVSGRRPMFARFYTEDGKTMPADKLKPIEDKVAELKSAVEAAAPRWHFPAGKPHNAAIEARVTSGVKAKFPGATVLATALDNTTWRIEKNDLGIPRYRALGALALVKIPGQPRPWLIFSSYTEPYSGGGTYSPGTFAPPFSDVRIQAGP